MRCLQPVNDNRSFAEYRKEYCHNWYIVNKIYQKQQIIDWREKNKDSLKKKRREYHKKYYSSNIHRKEQKARHRLNYFQEHGNLSHTDFYCAICGKQPVDFHHENYNLWYFFIPLCKSHHLTAHQRTFKKEL
jgi:hypothetical protein